MRVLSSPCCEHTLASRLIAMRNLSLARVIMLGVGWMLLVLLVAAIRSETQRRALQPGAWTAAAVIAGVAKLLGFWTPL